MKCIAYKKVKGYADAYLPCKQPASLGSHFCFDHAVPAEEVLLGLIDSGGFQDDYITKLFRIMISQEAKGHERTGRNR